MLAPSVLLLAYANPEGVLERADQADSLAAALRDCRRNFIELDFSGVAGVSRAFGERFCRLADTGLADVWLVPRNYGESCGYLIRHLQGRLQAQREQAWADACELLCTGFADIGRQGQGGR
jgi:hypothetical protein